MTDLASLRGEVADLIEKCSAAGLKIATAESCTGGLIAAAITEIPGASRVFDWGVVTYANVAKTDLLGIPPELIEQHGEVSEEVVIAMAEGALARSGADLSVAITGIAGPGGATSEKPVGLVHIASAVKGRPTVHVKHAFADTGRESIRLAAARQAIRMLIEQATAG